MLRFVRGISLMELLIVMVIIGLMAAIAYPNYRDYVERSKRNEAKAALLRIHARQESFYLQNHTYTDDMTDLGFPAANDVPTDSGTYTVDVDPGADATGYTARAIYQGGGTEATRCLTFLIDGQGVKSSQPLGDCWTRTR